MKSNYKNIEEAPDPKFNEWLESMNKWINSREDVKKTDDNTCTHIGDIAQCDQFICSKCGIHLEDWRMLVEEEYDYGYTEMANYEYEFKFCPNCGRKIVEE